jgi:hypothetical protein
MNVAGVLTNVASEQVVRNMQGVPVVTTPTSRSTSAAAPSGSDIHHEVVRPHALGNFNSCSSPSVNTRTRSDRVTSGLQLHSVHRYPLSVVEIQGLTPPTFTGS